MRGLLFPKFRRAAMRPKIQALMVINNALNERVGV